MATIVELATSGVLVKVDPTLGWRDLEMRRIYLLPKAHKWLLEVLPVTDSIWNIEETPAEQVEALFYEFCSGQPLPIGLRFKALVHLGDGIWELKTADLRLFGWFVQRDCFVVCDCNSAQKIKEFGLYQGYCRQAVHFRNNLNLNAPKFITGDNPDDVISDWY